jgi:hypothetical protein
MRRLDSKPEPASSYFLSPGKRIKGEGGRKTQIKFPHFLLKECILPAMPSFAKPAKFRGAPATSCGVATNLEGKSGNPLPRVKHRFFNAAALWQ